MAHQKNYNSVGKRGEIYKRATSLARELRKRHTCAESIVWTALRRKSLANLKFYRQRPIFFDFQGRISFYIPDFYCHSEKLVIEIDGPVHKQRAEYDEFRTEILQTLGLKVIRFSNEQVEENIDIVYQKLLEILRV